MRKRSARAAIVAFLLIAGAFSSAPVFAQTAGNPPPGSAPPKDERTPISTEIPLPVPSAALTPGSTPERVADYLTAGRVEDLAQYIGIIYNFLISIVGMVAAVMMIIAGFQYLTSAGDSGKIGAAKSRIANAFIGLVLALGAWTLLNTINPKLLQLKLPDFRKVQTELSYMPWCEEIQKGDPSKGIAGVPVTPASGTECGNIGTYKQGSSDLYCVYYGSCRVKMDKLRDDGTMRTHTCFQRADNTAAKLRDLAVRNPDAKVGYCKACAQLTKKTLSQMGYTDPQSGCVAWMVQTVDWRMKDDPNQRFWDYCAMTENNTLYPGCMQANVDCQAANDNEDLGGSDKDCSDGSNECGCEGYDDQPTPAYPLKDFPVDENLTKPGNIKVASGRNDTLDSYQLHLAAVCFWNPCKNYLDPDSGKQSFIRGCRNDNGLVMKLWNFSQHGDFRFDDCRAAN